jgi:hypothetical protein
MSSHKNYVMHPFARRILQDPVKGSVPLLKRIESHARWRTESCAVRQLPRDELVGAFAILGADDAGGLGGSPAKLRASVRTRSMGTVVRTMVTCMGSPFLWSGPWSSRAPARV